MAGGQGGQVPFDHAALAGRFAAAMARLGPFEPAPRLAVAVSGGADSLSLALLAADWAGARGGAVHALIVDHGLRPAAAHEAAETRARLATQGIEATVLRLEGLAAGAGLAARARAARYDALAAACRARGILHLLLGHHAADQAETLLIRALSGSGAAGFAAMPGLRETPFLRLLRPLLDEAPGALRAWLRGRGLSWVEDPSNASPLARRGRLRTLRADPAETAEAGGSGPANHAFAGGSGPTNHAFAGGGGPATRALAAAAHSLAAARAASEAAIAVWLARHVTISPLGFARIAPAARDQPMAAALAALLRTLAGGEFAPASAALARLAGDLRPATLGGVRLLAAGRLGPGWLAVREAAALAPPVAARAGAVWDGRFRLAAAPAREGVRLAALGPAPAAAGAGAAALRAAGRGLPAAVLATLPAYRAGSGALLAVPHLGWWQQGSASDWPVPLFAPPRPAAAAGFLAGPERGQDGRAMGICTELPGAAHAGDARGAGTPYVKAEPGQSRNQGRPPPVRRQGPPSEAQADPR